MDKLTQDQLDTIIEECEENKARIVKMELFIRLVYELALNGNLKDFRASSMKPELERMGIEL